jgi:methylglyoxal synthase
MDRNRIEVEARKKIALIAHDNKKDELLAWADLHRETLLRHDLFGTGTTGSLLVEQLDLPVTAFQSGPLGGDMQVGARIAEGEIDMLIFFWDPLDALPHDPDVKALLRLAVVWNIPVASNEATADFLVTSPHFDSEYERLVPDYDAHRRRLEETA